MNIQHQNWLGFDRALITTEGASVILDMQLIEINSKFGNVAVFADDFEIKDASYDAEDGVENIEN